MGGANKKENRKKNQKGKLDNEGKRTAVMNFLGIHDKIEIFVFFIMVASEYFQRENFPIDLVRPIFEQTNKILIAEEATAYKNRIFDPFTQERKKDLSELWEQNPYLLSQERKKKLSELWVLDSTKPKVFSYEQLARLGVIEDSDVIKLQQFVHFEWKQIGFDRFDVKGKIDFMPEFQRNFELSIEDLGRLDFLSSRSVTYSREGGGGIILNKENTMAFLYDNFYSNMKPNKK